VQADHRVGFSSHLDGWMDGQLYRGLHYLVRASAKTGLVVCYAERVSINTACKQFVYFYGLWQKAMLYSIKVVHGWMDGWMKG
jgi:hypothetical protein